MGLSLPLTKALTIHLEKGSKMFRYYQFINWSKLFFLDPDGIIFAFDENKRKKEKKEAKEKRKSFKAETINRLSQHQNVTVLAILERL